MPPHGNRIFWLAVTGQGEVGALTSALRQISAEGHCACVSEFSDSLVQNFARSAARPRTISREARSTQSRKGGTTPGGGFSQTPMIITGR